MRFLLAALAVCLFVPSAHAEDHLLDLIATKDTHIYKPAPSTSWGSSANVLIRWSPSGGVSQGLVFFDIDSIPEDATIESAELVLTPYGSFGDCDSAVIAVQNDFNWSGSTSWTDAQSGGSTENLTGMTTASQSDDNTWDVTDILENWHDGTATNQGLMLTYPSSSSSNPEWKFKSSDGSSDYPVLKVCYSLSHGPDDPNVAGDADRDGDVDFADFLTLSGNYGDPGDWEDGDFDGDGDVGFSDFLLLSANFGYPDEERNPPPAPE